MVCRRVLLEYWLVGTCVPTLNASANRLVGTCVQSWSVATCVTDVERKCQPTVWQEINGLPPGIIRVLVGWYLRADVERKCQPTDLEENEIYRRVLL